MKVHVWFTDGSEDDFIVPRSNPNAEEFMDVYLYPAITTAGGDWEKVDDWEVISSR